MALVAFNTMFCRFTEIVYLFEHFYVLCHIVYTIRREIRYLGVEYVGGQKE